MQLLSRLQPGRRQSIVTGMRVWTLSLSIAIAAAGCAAISSKPSEAAADQKCVVSTEPTMRMVTLAPPGGLDSGVTSLFFKAMPEVHPGDLVSVDNTAGQGGPKLDRIEPSAKACADVAQTAADHHKHHD